MKSLSEIKDQVAQEAGYENWDSIPNYGLDDHINKAILKAVEADRKDCAENMDEYGPYSDPQGYLADVEIQRNILDRPYPPML